MNVSDQRFKKKSKTKPKEIVSEGDYPNESFLTETGHTPKAFKTKKRHRTVSPLYVIDSGSALENERDGSSNLQPDTVLISDEPSTSGQLLKKRKKKKESEIKSFQVPEEHYPLVSSEEKDGKEEDVGLEQIHIEADEDFSDGWSKEDLKELFSRMSQAVPKNDSFKATSRLQKLDWEQIKFNNHTAADCQEKWRYVEKKLRGFRLLGELLDDANTWLEKSWTNFYRSKRKEEVKLYLDENPNFKAPPFKSVLSKAEKEILDRVEGKPEKQPNSAYSLFSRLMLKDPNIKERYETPKQRLKEIARLWKEEPTIGRIDYAEKRTKPYTAENIMAMEPPQIPTEPFILFRDEYLKKGLSEKRAIKAWVLLSELEKKNYKLRLEKMKAEYHINYPAFLKRLNPVELKLYSEIRENRNLSFGVEEEEEIDEEEAESSATSQIEDSDDSS